MKLTQKPRIKIRTHESLCQTDNKVDKDYVFYTDSDLTMTAYFIRKDLVDSAEAQKQVWLLIARGAKIPDEITKELINGNSNNI